MVHLFQLPFFLIACNIIGLIAAQANCGYNTVQSISLSVDGILIWKPSPFGECTIDNYIVTVTSLGFDDERIFVTDQPQLDVSYLPICETVRIMITPRSPSGSSGQSRYFVENMPVPKHMNLTIESVKLSQTSEGVTLTWQVEGEYMKCAKRYRVMVYDEDADNPVDIYVTPAYARLDNLIPCTSYIFGVTALYNLEEEGPVITLRYKAPEALIAAPLLKTIRQGTTTADLIWEMESVAKNRCPVSSVTLDASPAFTISFPVRDQNSRTNFPTSLTGLQSDTMYVLKVTAVTTAGQTAPTIVAIQTLATGNIAF